MYDLLKYHRLKRLCKRTVMCACMLEMTRDRSWYCYGYRSCCFSCCSAGCMPFYFNLWTCVFVWLFGRLNEQEHNVCACVGASALHIQRIDCLICTQSPEKWVQPCALSFVIQSQNNFVYLSHIVRRSSNLSVALSHSHSHSHFIPRIDRYRHNVKNCTATIRKVVKDYEKLEHTLIIISRYCVELMCVQKNERMKDWKTERVKLNEPIKFIYLQSQMRWHFIVSNE